jgi:RHS repeat-associated protein
VENSGDAGTGGRNCEESYYYNHNWQLLEIRNADDKPRQQFVWGTQYIDEPICMDVDTDTTGEGYGNCTDEGSRRFWYMQDANYNVIALREAGTIVERYEYDPYGTVRVVRGWNDAAAAEDGSVAGQSLKWLDATLPRNPYLYAGYFHDWETGLDYVRNRMYSHGVWMQRDPAAGPGEDPQTQYLDGGNLYEYVKSAPVRLADSTGRAATEPGGGAANGCPCAQNPGDCYYEIEWGKPVGGVVAPPWPPVSPKEASYAKRRCARPEPGGDCSEYTWLVQMKTTMIMLKSRSGRDMSQCSLHQEVLGKEVKPVCGFGWSPTFGREPNDIYRGRGLRGGNRYYAWLFHAPAWGPPPVPYPCRLAARMFKWKAEVYAEEAPSLKLYWGFDAVFNYPKSLPAAGWADGTVDLTWWSWTPWGPTY